MTTVPRQILVGVDVSSDSELVAANLSPATATAVDRAIWLAGQTGAALHFVNVLNIPTVATEDILEESAEAVLTRDSTIVLETLVDRAKSKGIAATFAVRNGRIVEELVREVLRRQPDLLVIGSHPQGLAERFLFGSKATKVLRKCPCPVWVTKSGELPETPLVMAAEDLSEGGVESIPTAVMAAQWLAGRLLVVHAVNFPLDRRLYRTGVTDEELQVYREKVRHDAQQQLQERLWATDHRTIPGGVKVEVLPGPRGRDRAGAEDNDPHLLVMGTIGRGGLSGLLLGNTVEELLPRIRCSLLAIKPEGFVCPVKLPD
ncbi:MAG: universal stress protein [Planctomycetaceae bacterium]